ncbi:diguanylate cyclase [Caballeronia sp. LZ016]|uniref:diguanylate cyclase n=1 Tax=Caballeronia sp. LZ016 TaxID=3038554 RepID=UPI002855BA13|nr:diguanylate cyclase [Caballeronia sp. LZ016]MDR5740205.1 diguanylate cyclase [Caballeronia sp. LZ016]
MDAALEELWALATRSRLKVALYFIDADDSKAYNDQHGHDAGDRALQLIAEFSRAMHAAAATSLRAMAGRGLSWRSPVRTLSMQQASLSRSAAKASPNH